MSRKFLNPPVLTSVDDLMELIRDPQKYAEHLTELRDLQAAIMAQLDTLHTKDEAEILLRRAAAKMDEAVAREADVNQRQADADRLMRAAKAERDAVTEETKTVRLELQKEHDILNSQRQSFMTGVHEQEAQIRFDRDALEQDTERLRLDRIRLDEDKRLWKAKVDQLSSLMRG